MARRDEEWSSGQGGMGEGVVGKEGWGRECVLTILNTK